MRKFTLIVLVIGFLFIGCDNGSGTMYIPSKNSGPFAGSWYSPEGSGVTLVCKNSTWEIIIGPPADKCGMKGSYTFADNSATFTITHVKDISGNWVTEFPADDGGYEPSVVYGMTSLPQTFTGTLSGSQLNTTSGAGTFDVITYSGTVWKGSLEEVTWEIEFISDKTFRLGNSKDGYGIIPGTYSFSGNNISFTSSVWISPRNKTGTVSGGDTLTIPGIANNGATAVTFTKQ